MAHVVRIPCRRAAWICAIVGFGAACTGPVHRMPPPPSTDIEEMAFRDSVRVLASDEFEGRRPGTPGEEKTVAYLVERFHKLGLKPGNGDSYLQQVPMAEITADGGASLTFSGGAGTTQRLEYAKDMVIWTKREAPEASLTASEVVFLGYGIVAPQYSWNDYDQVDVRGKTVVVMVGDPGYATKDPKVFRGNRETYYGRWTYKVEEATRHGAAGILMIHDTGSAGHGWEVVVNTRTGPQRAAGERRPCRRAVG